MVCFRCRGDGQCDGCAGQVHPLVWLDLSGMIESFVWNSSTLNGDVSLAFYMCVDNSIGDDGAKALAATLHTLTSLQSLYLGGFVYYGVCWVD